MALLKLSSPWVIFYKKINAMFEDDPEIKVVFDEEENIVKLYVDNPDKADALSQVLPKEKEFGAVTLKIEVVPANKEATERANTANKLRTVLRGNEFESLNGELLENALIGNPAFLYAKTITGVFTNPITYIVFMNKVVQYYTDSLSDINGFTSTLYQDIAKDIFLPFDGIFYCTEAPYMRRRYSEPNYTCNANPY